MTLFLAAPTYFKRFLHQILLKFLFLYKIVYYKPDPVSQTSRDLYHLSMLPTLSEYIKWIERETLLSRKKIEVYLTLQPARCPKTMLPRSRIDS